MCNQTCNSNKPKCCGMLCLSVLCGALAAAAVLLCCFIFAPEPAGLTVELTNKRLVPILNDETIVWDDTVTEVNDKITYDSSTGEMTVHRSGYYYVSYYFNVVPDTISSDFCFELQNATETKLGANGSGASSGSPTSYVCAQGVLYMEAGETLWVRFTSQNAAGILPGDVFVQGSFSVFGIGT